MTLTAMMVGLLMAQSATGAVVWETPSAPVVAATPDRAAPDLPDWARADPFAWERSQCSPLVRGDEPMQTCQSRVRGDLYAALGDNLPAGLRPAAELTDCGPQPDENYATACNAPRREPAIRPTPEQDCRSRPQRQGQGVAWTQDCRPLREGERETLRLRLGGND